MPPLIEEIKSIRLQRMDYVSQMVVHDSDSCFHDRLFGESDANRAAATAHGSSTHHYAFADGDGDPDTDRDQYAAPDEYAAADGHFHAVAYANPGSGV